MDQTELARAIYETCHLTGKFLLRSGQTSHEYFDKYLFEADPRLLEAVAAQLAGLVPAEAELLAGLEMGGVPVGALLAQKVGKPCLFVRKKAKEYGTRKIAEGPAFEGRKVVIVEDVVTSGGQILLSAEELRQRGAVLGTVLCVIDREAGGAEKLAAAGLELRPLFTKSQLEQAVGITTS